MVLVYSVIEGLNMKKGLITVKKAAELFGVTIETIRRWDRTGKLKAIRHPMNNYRLYRLIDLQKVVGKMEKL